MPDSQDSNTHTYEIEKKVKIKSKSTSNELHLHAFLAVFLSVFHNTHSVTHTTHSHIITPVKMPRCFMAKKLKSHLYEQWKDSQMEVESEQPQTASEPDSEDEEIDPGFEESQQNTTEPKTEPQPINLAGKWCLMFF